MTDLSARAWYAYVLIASVALASPAWPQPPTAEVAASEVRAQLRALDAEGALAALSRLESARGPVAPDFEFLFLAGATWQQVAKRGGLSERSVAIDKAHAAYKHALELQSSSPAIFNNIGGLYSLTGDHATAGEWYRRAVESAPSDRKGYYALNYARELRERDPATALRYARMALESTPQAEEARVLVGRLLAGQPDGEALIRFLAVSTVEGRSRLAIDLALDDLLARRDRPALQRAQVLEAVAHAVARDPRIVGQMTPAGLQGRLRALTGDEAVGSGAAQLASVLEVPPPSANALTWWRPYQSRTRASAMRRLLLVLGKERDGVRARDAEGYYAAAIDLGDEGPDPDAFLRQVELLVNRGQVARLSDLMGRYESELFSEKGVAYRRNDFDLIFRMHLALGMTYAHMNVWNSQVPFRNATFQLERAAAAAKDFNRRAEQTGNARRLAIPPVAVFKLAEAYDRGGKADLATQVRVDSASDLAAAKRPQDSKEVFRTIDAARIELINPASQARYRMLSSQLERL